MALVQVRRGTAASAASNNPTLSAGEPSYETDTGVFKIGDGATTYNSLAPASTPNNLSGFTPPPSTGWTSLGSPTVTTSYSSRLMTETAVAGDSIRGEYRTLSPTSNYTATFYFDWSLPATNYAQAGILLRNSGGNLLIFYGASYSAGMNLGAVKWTSQTVFSANYRLIIASNFTPFPNWLRIRDDSTNRYYEYSPNGVDWVLFQSTTRTDFLTPDQIGWGHNPNNTGGAYTTAARLRSFKVT